MTVNTIITKADSLRPNAIDNATKKLWVKEVEIEIAEMMGEELDWSAADPTLLLDDTHCNTYVFYVCAMIDYFNQETQEYGNDMVMYNNALANAKAYYRRNNKPNGDKNIVRFF